MSGPAASRRRADEPIPLHLRALADLTYIRQTMERATVLTSVPGWGGIAMGVTALGAAWFASRQTSAAEWLAVWLGEAVLALGVGGVAMIRKAEATGASLVGRAGRLFAGAFAPPVLAGAVLTGVLYGGGEVGLLPGLWLLLYGVGVTTAGAYSVRPVPVMGICFMGLGVVTFFLPAGTGDLMLALGFGGLHLVFGWLIATRHGG